jgi:outer membrane immunogenic protein
MSKFIAKSVVAAAGAFLLMGSQAYAGGLTEDYNGSSIWGGLYIGAHAGIGWSSYDATVGGHHYSDDDTDFIGGLQVGYNWAMSEDMLYGVEADYTFINGDVGTIRGRIGKVIGDKMIYATAGIAFPDDGDAGFVGGLGVEWDLSHRWQNVTAGVEGLYYTTSDDYGDSDAFALRGRVNYHLDMASAPLK